MSYCGNCAHEIRIGGKFCPVDGTPKGKGTKFCNNCGIQLKPNARFCGKCRYEVGSGKVPKAIAVQPISPLGRNQSQNTKPGQCSSCLTENGVGVKICILCGKTLTNILRPPVKPIKPPAPPVSPVKPRVKPGQCANCKKQNEARVTTCVFCGKSLANPLYPPIVDIRPPAPPIKPEPQSNKTTRKVEKYSSIVDNKGRATIPKKVREKLGILEGTSIVYIVEGDNIIVNGTKSKKAGKNP